MKLLKSTHLLGLLFILLFQTSCSYDISEVSEDFKPKPDAEAQTINEDPLKKRYHFIRFNFKDPTYFDFYVAKLNKLVNLSGGEILTLGQPEECLERICKDVNIVIEFPTEEIGISFFENYKNIQPLAELIGTDFAYLSAASFQIPNVFDNSVKGEHYLVVNLNHLDLPNYIVNFARPTVALLLQKDGILVSDDFRTQKCLLGDCYEYSVLIKFQSRESARKWFFSDEQQTLQLVGEELTEVGSVLFAPSF